jgi:hypothetical protein
VAFPVAPLLSVTLIRKVLFSVPMSGTATGCRPGVVVRFRAGGWRPFRPAVSVSLQTRLGDT